MSKIINDIKSRVSKMHSLVGYECCALVNELDEKATEQEWINAWNTDQSIIMGMINDMELLCGEINKEDYE